MKPKFNMFSFVRVREDCHRINPNYSLFKKGFYGIVKGTYSQLYGGDNTKDYSLYVIENGKVVNEVAWFNEDRIVLMPDQNSGDVARAVELIEAYSNRKN